MAHIKEFHYFKKNIFHNEKSIFKKINKNNAVANQMKIIMHTLVYRNQILVDFCLQYFFLIFNFLLSCMVIYIVLDIK